MLKNIMRTSDRWENRIREILYRFRIPIFLVAVTVLAVWARKSFFYMVSNDFVECLDPWLNEIRAGGLASIGDPLGNYPPPYRYILTVLTFIPGLNNLQIIKYSSTVFDVFLAVAAALLVLQLTRSKWKAAAAYCAVLILPTVFLNSAAWGQCDALYTAVALLSFYFWLRGKRGLGLFIFGLAMSIKLQAIFVLPVFVILWLVGQLRVRHVLAAAGGYIAACLPAMLFAGSLRPLYYAYSLQTVVNTLAGNIHTGLSLLNGLNQDDVHAVSGGLVLFALLAIGLLAFCVWQKRAVFTKQSAFILLFVTVCLVPFILPGMKDRYYYMAEIVSLLYVFVRPSRFIAPLCLQLASITSYMIYLRQAETGFGPWLILAAAVPLFIALWDLYRSLIQSDNDILGDVPNAADKTTASKKKQADAPAGQLAK